MEITTAPTVTSLHSTASAATEAKKTMDSEVFLALLVAQMRNQDPTSPMDTSDMMAQSTQLASMEQLTAVANTSRESFALQMRIAALNLVGQEVSYVDASGEVHDGVVEEVSFAFDVPMVRIGDDTVPLDSVAGARAAARTTTPTTGATDGSATPATDGDTSPAPEPASGTGSTPAA